MTQSATSTELPVIIQGGMGAAISSWRLAAAVARRGQLGVVSGTAIERVLACRLQEGDRDGHLRRILARCPLPALAARVVERWFRPEGLPQPGQYQPVPMFAVDSAPALIDLAVAAGYAEVALAKDGHDGPVGINLLEKIQLPTLPVLYGALLAGVDAVLMGAGIPRDIPGHLDRLVAGQAASLRLAVAGAEAVTTTFDPARFAELLPALRRPRFLAIVASDTLAQSLARSGGIDGFIVEGPTAGGHNAPPRGGGTRNERGEPVYGPRDQPDLSRLRQIGLPFWLAGGYATRERLESAWASGARGVQVGTPFVLCDESNLEPALRQRLIAAVREGSASVFTDPTASPTGFPFKLVPLPGTEGGRPADERPRQPCTLGYLREAYRTDTGAVAWRCPAEPIETWVAKGGDPAACAGRRCLCHGLMASAGHPHQHRDGSLELPLVTAGDDLSALTRYLRPDRSGYRADAVLDALLTPTAG